MANVDQYLTEEQADVLSAVAVLQTAEDDGADGATVQEVADVLELSVEDVRITVQWLLQHDQLCHGIDDQHFIVPMNSAEMYELKTITRQHFAREHPPYDADQM